MIVVFILGIVLGCTITAIISQSNCIASKVKVDYSIEAKKHFGKSMPGEYAVYVRRNILHKWVER